MYFVSADPQTLHDVSKRPRSISSVEYALESVTVVSGDNNQSLVKDAKLLKLRDGSIDSVVELEKIAESTVVVHS